MLFGIGVDEEKHMGSIRSVKCLSRFGGKESFTILVASHSIYGWWCKQDEDTKILTIVMFSGF